MSFFKRLAKKAERTPHIKVEQDLFRKLDEAFTRDFKPKPSFDFLFDLFKWAPLGAVAALVVVLGIQVEQTRPIERFADSEAVFKMEDVGFYQDLEDWMLTASDQDWEELLDEKES